MNKSFFKRLCLFTMLVAAAFLGACQQRSEIDEYSADTAEKSASEFSYPAVSGKNNESTDSWPTMKAFTSLISLEEECCESTGHADKCWEADALADDLDGYIFCKTDADCGGRVCNKNSKVLTALSSYPNVGGGTYGLCECGSNADCRNTDGKGGSCFNFGDDGSGVSKNLCGPTMCNGYYVCSCWGGCVWWDGNNNGNTPMEDAGSLGMFCCKNENYSNPTVAKGLVLFGDKSCADMYEIECNTAAECDAPSVHDPTMADQCVSVACNLVTNKCVYTPKTGQECDLDNDICTLDRCEANGTCVFKTPRVTADTFGSLSEDNTCTEDCVPAVDNLSYTAYVPLAQPQDIATRVTTDACHTWTCVTNSGVTYPAEKAVTCTDSNPSDCAIPVCNPTGTPENCSDAIAVTCSGTPSPCNTPVCLDGAGGCTEVFDAAQANDTSECTPLENPLYASRQPNCESKCDSQTHSMVLSEQEGICSDLYAVNDSCATADDLGDFTATNNIRFLDAKGTTACATNQHHSGNTTCKEPATGSLMGHASPDVVYMFQYEPVDDGIQDEYVVKVESYTTAFDESVYLSVGASSCVTGAVASEDCEIYLPSTGKSHEDHCSTTVPHPVSHDLCAVKDTTGVYSGGMGRAILLEDESNFSAGLITVYIYVDGNTEYASKTNYGDFYLSVEKISPSGCPPLSSWYTGAVNLPTGLPLGLPINGSNFPGVTPNTLTGSNGRIANGVLLNGYTGDNADLYSYDPTLGDVDPFEWNGFDEAWQLDVQSAAQFTISLCDFGSSVADPTYDTMIGLFDCYGERVISNDNGASIPYYPEGASLCVNGKSHIKKTPTVDVSKGPYYIIADGYYQPGIRGKESGSNYRLAVYYDPFGDVDCDPADPDGFGLIRSGGTGTYPDRATISIANDQCALLVNASGSDVIPGRTISFHWDGGLSGPTNSESWKCISPNIYGYCTPMTLILTMIYTNAGGDRCTETIVDWSHGSHGNYNPIYVPTTLTTVDGVTCDQFVGIATRYRMPPNLTAAQRSECANRCSIVNLKFDG